MSGLSFSFRNKLWALSAVLLLQPLVILPTVSQGQENPSPAATPTQPKDRYAVPETEDPAALLKFIEDLRNFQPESAGEFLEHRRKAPEAMRAAAEKILKLDPERKTAAATRAISLLLQVKVQGMLRATPDEQKLVYTEVAQLLNGAKQLSRNELSLAFATAQALEMSQNKELASEAYMQFGAVFAKQMDETLASYGKKMEGAARRIQLPGNEMVIKGTTHDGKPFDWAAYRGKVVLVDFWATWCGPCIQELPNVKAMYEKYNKKGFDVVGISLDNNREKLDTFLKNEQIPWVTLFQEPGGWENEIANYYGVMAIPTVILVNKEGKVITLNARGEELGKQLELLLGDAAQ